MTSRSLLLLAVGLPTTLMSCGRSHSPVREPLPPQSTTAPSSLGEMAEAKGVLREFLGALSEAQVERAYTVIAPSSKAIGDPIARAKLDYDSFATEVAESSPVKFTSYQLGERREEWAGRVRIWLHFGRAGAGDSDETLLLQEGGRWYVADPIHIIR